MAMTEHAQYPQSTGGVEAASFEFFLKAGDRYYHRDADISEPASLLSEALDEYARALELAPDTPEALCRMGKTFFRQGEYAKAERYARKSLKLLKTNSVSKREAAFVRREACYILGQIHLRNGNPDKAREAYKASAQSAGLAGARARLGFWRASCQAAKNAGSAFKAVLFGIQGLYALLTSALLFPFERERVSLPGLLALVPQLLLAWLSEEMGSIREARGRYLDIYRRFPGFAGVGIIIGDIDREQGEPEKAIYWFRRVIERHPANLDAHYHLAKLLEQQEDYTGMIEVYGKLARLRPGDPHVFCNLANAYFYNQQPHEALTHYITALHAGTDPKWKAMVAQSVGNLYADYMQNYEAAMACYEMARTLNPEDVENYIQLGLLHFQQDDYRNAELVYRQALAIAPEKPRLYCNLGYLRWMAGDIDTAVQYYGRAIELDDSYEIPVNNLGVIHLDTLGRIHKAIELFQRAIEINENYSLAYFNLGRAHSFLGNRLEAANCFHRAQELNQYSRDLDNDELTDRINHLFESGASD